MRSLKKYPKLKSLQESSSGIEKSLIYIHGIAKNKSFDSNGFPINNSNCTIYNFSSILTKNVPTSEHDEFYIRVSESEQESFIYEGIAVIGDEIVYIKPIIGLATGENEVKIRVIRAQNNTKGSEYPVGTIIRSVVNISDKILHYSYNTKSEVTGGSLFQPPVSSGNISMVDDIRRWSNFLDEREFEIKRKLPIYIFNGSEDELVCDYIGFIIDFDLDSYEQQIDISFENKFSLYYEEELRSNKIYRDLTAKEFLSDVLDIPMSMISYPTDSSGLEIYSDSDFFKINILSLKDFSSYQDLISSLCKELCIRMTFDSKEKLIIQSDVKQFNNEDSVKKYKFIKFTLGDKYSIDGSFLSNSKQWNDIKIFSKENSIIRPIKITTNSEPYNSQYTTENIFDNNINTKYITKNMNSNAYIICELPSEYELSKIQIFNKDLNDKNRFFYKNTIIEIGKSIDSLEKIFDSNISGEYIVEETGREFELNKKISNYIEVSLNETNNFATINSKTSDKIIINKIDGKFTDVKTYYNREDFIAKEKVFKSISEAKIDGDYDIAIVNDIYYRKQVMSTGDNTCSMGWAKKGTYKNKIVFPVKYSYNKKLSDIKILKTNALNEPEFNAIEVVVGKDVKYFKIGKSYVMFTDGKNDFMGKVADVIIKENELDSSIVIALGYDMDRSINYFGRVDYLNSIGYSNNKEFYMYYGRSEYVYVSEWKKGSSENTSTINFPLKAGETYEITGEFGGIDTPDGSFNGMVDDIDNIYGIFTKNELLYSREYNMDIPMYIRCNEFSPNKNNLKYTNFDNSNLALVMSRNYKNKESSFSFVKASEQNEYNSKNDYIANFVNMKHGFEIKKKNEIGEIKKDTILTTLEWSEDEIKDSENRVWDSYKVNYQGENIFVRKADYDVVVEKYSPVKTFGIGIEVKDVSPFDIGDFIMLDVSNKEDINTKDNYNKYSDARWIIKSISKDKDTDINGVLILDFEYPEGLNNYQLSFTLWKAKDSIVLQEFGIKGNPFINIESTFFNEISESIDNYGKNEYDGITGRFIGKDDLVEATSYLLNGFGATNINNTKSLIKFSTNLRYDIDVLDIIEITDRAFTGYNRQKSIIIEKNIENSNGQSEVEFTAMTVGTYDLLDDLIISSNFEYAPSVPPIYNHDGNSGEDKEDEIDLSNEQISKFDKKLGSISLVKINTNNLIAKSSIELSKDSSVLEISNISSMLTDEKRKHYTDILLSNNKSLFIQMNSEFMYVKCLSFIKDERDIVLSAKLEIRNRGVFGTTIVSSIASGTPVEFYQITQMSNEDGIYSTGSTFGDIENREYFKFDTEDGVGLETSRGYLNISTEADWVGSLRKKFGLNEEMSKDEVLDYTGRGLIQIGNSSSINELAEEWELMLDLNIPNAKFIGEYITNKISSYNTSEITELKIKLELDDKWVEIVLENNNFDLNKFLIPSINTINFENYRCNILSIKNNIDDHKLNLYNVNGIINIFDKDNYGYYKFTDSNNGYNIFSYGRFNDNVVSDIGIGNNIGGASDYKYTSNADKYKHKRIVIYVKKISTEVELGYLRYTRRGGLEVKGDISIDSGSININNISRNNYMKLNDNVGYIGIGTNGSTNEDIVRNKAYFQVGDLNSLNYFKFDGEELKINSSNITINNNQNNNHINITENSSELCFNKNGLGRSKFSIGNYSTGDNNHIYYENGNLSIKFSNGRIGNEAHNLSIRGGDSKLFLNSGSQQIGTNILDSSSPTDGYDGFYFGDTVNGIGRLSTGRYLKYDGTTFQIGSRLTMYNGDTPIVDLDKVVEHSSNELLKGTTTITDNVLRIYSDGQYIRATTKLNKSVSIKGVGTSENKNRVPFENFGHSGSIGNISNISDINLIGQGIFIQIWFNGQVVDTYKIDYVNTNLRYIELSSNLPDDRIYDLYIEDVGVAAVKIGDLRKTIDTGEFIRIGVGVNYNNPLSKGIKIIDDSNMNFFKFDSIDGLALQTDGVVDIRNGGNQTSTSFRNRLYFSDELNSYLYLNNGQMQLGKLSNIHSSLNANNNIGFFVGDNINANSYMYWNNNTLNIKGNISITGGEAKEKFDSIDTSISGLQTDVKKFGSAAYISTTDPRYSEEWAKKNKPDSEHVGELWINPDNGIIKTFILLNSSYVWKDVETTNGTEAENDSKQKARVFVSDLYELSNITNGSTKANSNDTWVVRNKQNVNGVYVYSPKTYIYLPSNQNKNGIPVNTTSKSDWILFSSDNTNFIDLRTDDSTLYFDSRVNTVDKIEIAKNGKRGYFSVGNIRNDDYFYFTANDGVKPKLDISTTGKFFLRNLKNGVIENKIFFDSTSDNDVISMGKGSIQIGKVNINKSSVNYLYKGLLITDNYGDLSSSNNIMMFNLDSNPNSGLFNGKRFYIKTNGNIELAGGKFDLSSSSIMNLTASTLNISGSGSVNITSNSSINLNSNSSIKIEGNSNVTINSGTINMNANGRFFVNSGTFEVDSDNVSILTKGELMVSNSKNMLYFKKDGTSSSRPFSKFQLNTEETNNIFQIGRTTESSYISYDGSNVRIGGSLIAESSDKRKIITIENGAIRFSEKLANGSIVDTRVIRKMAFGVAKHGDIVNLLVESNGATWNNPAVVASLSSVSTSGEQNMRSINVEAKKIEEHKYRIEVTSSRYSLSDNTVWGTNWNSRYSANNQPISSGNIFQYNSTLTNTVYVKYRIKSQALDRVYDSGNIVITLYWKISSSAVWSSKVILSQNIDYANDTGYITIPAVLDPSLEGKSIDMYATITGNTGKCWKNRYPQASTWHSVITEMELNIGRRTGEVVEATGGTATWYAFER